MQARLHGPDRVTRDVGDLLEGKIAVEAQEDDVPLVHRQRRDGVKDGGSLLQAQGRRLGIMARLEHRSPWIERLGVQADLLAAGGEPGDRHPNGDAPEPGTERTLAPKRGEGSVRSQECVLGDVLGLAWVAEDPLTSGDHGLGLAFDERAKRLVVARDDGIDKLAVLWSMFVHDRFVRPVR